MLFGGVIGFFIGYLCGIIHQEKVYNELRKLQDRKEEKSARSCGNFPFEKKRGS